MWDSYTVIVPLARLLGQPPGAVLNFDIVFCRINPYTSRCLLLYTILMTWE